MSINTSRVRRFSYFVVGALLLCLLTLALNTSARAAGTAPPKRRAVLVLVNAIGLEDLEAARMPKLMRVLKRRGAIALMNVRTAGAYLPEHAYVSLGSGTRAFGSQTSPLAFMSAEPYLGEAAGSVYARNTGFTAPPAGAVALGFPYVSFLNSDLDHPVQLGALGQALRTAGKKVAVIGNADDAQGPSRLVVMAAMDERGQVPLGNVGPGMTRADPGFPSGRRTDYRAVLSEFDRLYPRADVIVIETGDTARLNANRDWIVPEILAQARLAALRRVDDFLGQLATRMDWRTTRLLVVSPGPAADAVANNALLTLAMMAGEGVTPGLLYAPTTRRAGLVTMADIAPTITDWVGAPEPRESMGRVMQSSPFVGAVSALTRVNRRIIATYSQRKPVLQTYVVLQIIVILGAILALFFISRGPFGIARWLQHILLALTAVPLALLLLPPLASGDLGVDALILLGLTLSLVFVALAGSRGGTGSFLIVYALTALAVVADVATGARLGRASILGYDPMGGSRFYGLGNEYMGVVIGAATIAATTLLDRFPKLIRFRYLVVLPPLALVAFVIGAPGYGANVGGFIAAVFTLLAAWLALRRRRLNLWMVVWAAFLALILLGALALYESLRPATEATHLGELLRLVREGGVQEFYTVATRKLAMNWKLMRYTPWADGLLTFLIVLGVLFYRPVGLLRKVIKKNPYFNKGFWVALVGTVAAFLANDSGVVAAATLMLYPIALLLAYSLESVGPGAGSGTTRR